MESFGGEGKDSGDFGSAGDSFGLSYGTGGVAEDTLGGAAGGTYGFGTG